VCFEPVHDVDHADTPLGHGRLTAVQPRIDNDIDTAVLRELDSPGPSPLIRNASQVIANSRPEDLLASRTDQLDLVPGGDQPDCSGNGGGTSQLYGGHG